MNEREKQIAIILEIQPLINDIFLYWPKNYVYGLEQDNKLYFETGKKNYLSSNCIPLPTDHNRKNCYDFVIHLDDLKDRYQYENIEACAADYLEELSESLHIGIANHTTNCIDMHELPMYQLKQLFKNPSFSINNDDIVEINLTKKQVEYLIKTKSIDEIKKFFEMHFKHMQSMENLYKNKGIQNISLNAKGEITTIKTTSKANSLPYNNSENKNKNPINIIEMETYLKERIFGQDESIKSIVTTIAMNMRTNDPKKIRKSLIVGPTGCGKTETLEVLAEYLNIPYTIYSAPDLSASGYVGKDIEDILKVVYENSNHCIQKTERGILFIDEIDKLAKKGHDDIVNAQPSLLKLLEGHIYDVEIRPKNNIRINTKLMNIFCGGAFQDLKNTEEKVAGFNVKLIHQFDQQKNLSIKEFVEYGMMPEFMGRFTTKLFFNKLSKEDLKNILYHSKISAYLLEKELLKETFGVDVKAEESYFNEILNKAEQLDTGARSLKEIVSKSFEEIEHQLLIEEINGNRYQIVQITGETIKNNKIFSLKK